MTKFRPILFSTPMVQAQRAGTKTMTRRTKGLEKFNEAPNEWRYDGIDEDGDHFMEMIDNSENPLEYYKIVIPAYQVGDILWVRENFYAASNWDKHSSISLSFLGVDIYYYSDIKNHDIPQPLHRGKTRPSIFMPKTACRTFLKVKNSRVERLQDISAEDVLAEGVRIPVSECGDIMYILGEKNKAVSFIDLTKPNIQEEILKAFWAELWCNINGRESYDANPHVFVYEFERIEKPLDFI